MAQLIKIEAPYSEPHLISHIIENVLPKDQSFATIRGKIDDVSSGDAIITKLTTFFDYINKSSDMRRYTALPTDNQVNLT